MRKATGTKNNFNILSKSLSLRNSGEFETAINLLVKALQSSPTDVALICELAHIYYLKQDYIKFKRYLSHAKKLSPEYSAVTLHNIRAFILNKQIDEAEKLAQVCLSNKPKSLEAELLLATCLYYKNMNAEGLTLVEDIISHNPKNAEALILRAQFSLRIDNYEAAYLDLKQAYHIKPFLKQIWDITSRLCVKCSDYKLCIEILNRVEEYLGLTTNQKIRLAGCHYSQEDYQKALHLYEDLEATSLNSPEVFLNLGVTYSKLRKLDKAFSAFTKSLTLNPKYVKAHINIAACEIELDQLPEALSSYEQALRIDNHNIEAWQDLLSLKIQTTFDLEQSVTTWLLQHFSKAPTLNVLLAINSFIEGKLLDTVKCLNNLDTLNREIETLSPTNQKFIYGYKNLLKKATKYAHPDNRGKELYHFGESHCLSFANRNVLLNNETYTIKPMITFGAKAFHLSTTTPNKHKAVTAFKLKTLPFDARILISFGEIDCRADEGIILASKKYGVSSRDIISSTVKGFVEWFTNQNKKTERRLTFISVPAPMWEDTISHGLNRERARIVEMFNAALSHQIQLHRHNLVDVYKPTRNEKGFSNQLYHIDNYHLGHSILPIVQAQL